MNTKTLQEKKEENCSLNLYKCMLHASAYLVEMSLDFISTSV